MICCIRRRGRRGARPSLARAGGHSGTISAVLLYWHRDFHANRWRLRSRAIARGDLPAANSAKMRRTTAASASTIDKLTIAANRRPLLGTLVRNAIALGPATARISLASAHGAFHNEVFEEQGIHSALQTDVKLTHLANRISTSPAPVFNQSWQKSTGRSSPTCMPR